MTTIKDEIKEWNHINKEPSSTQKEMDAFAAFIYATRQKITYKNRIVLAATSRVKIKIRCSF
jgi:acetone carboxylase gamma subunit